MLERRRTVRGVHGRGVVAACLAGVLGAAAAAQGPGVFTIASASCPRVADPKLDHARIDIRVGLGAASGWAKVGLTLWRGDAAIGQIWSGRVDCALGPFRYAWDGRLPAPQSTVRVPVEPGGYVLRIDATEEATGAIASQPLPLQIVRLGITEIAALPNGPQTEWQMVYFKRGSAAGAAFYATPAIHEYLNVADVGEVSDLDRNDGSPRPPVPLHAGTASPPMAGTAYEDNAYNFPLCYLVGTAPRFAVRFGANGTGAAGQRVAAKYPVPGVLIRCVADSSLGPWTSTDLDIAPGRTATFVGPQLPTGFGCIDAVIEWTFECSDDGGVTWQHVPGHLKTPHRFYTILGTPRFGQTTGTQYAGPWVEVVDYVHKWQVALGLDAHTPTGLTEIVIKGFGGQVGTLPAAIEGVVYDTNILGGDGGASHYYTNGHIVQLSRLLDNRANGRFVNCSDCASSTAAMLGMLGLENVQMQRLGSMTLRAIRGIGAPSYTLALWGTSHSFGYHHIITRSAGATVCDATMWVDEDGNPNALPGRPGFNCDRPWSGAADSYTSLAMFGTTSFSLQPLPALQ
jgi:hypothetical protein